MVEASYGSPKMIRVRSEAKAMWLRHVERALPLGYHIRELEEIALPPSLVHVRTVESEVRASRMSATGLSECDQLKRLCHFPDEAIDERAQSILQADS